MSSPGSAGPEAGCMSRSVERCTVRLAVVVVVVVEMVMVVVVVFP